jgi:hypothetical protein
MLSLRAGSAPIRLLKKTHMLRYAQSPRCNVRLCENSEGSKTVGKGNHISSKINDLIPKSVPFMLQSGTT